MKTNKGSPGDAGIRQRTTQPAFCFVATFMWNVGGPIGTRIRAGNQPAWFLKTNKNKSERRAPI